MKPLNYTIDEKKDALMKHIWEQCLSCYAKA